MQLLREYWWLSLFLAFVLATFLVRAWLKRNKIDEPSKLKKALPRILKR